MDEAFDQLAASDLAALMERVRSYPQVFPVTPHSASAILHSSLAHLLRKGGRATACTACCGYPLGMTDVFLHNPRCSKSRAALDLVRAAGVELPVREYLQDPLASGELRRIVELLGVRPIDLVRRGEPHCAALGLNDATPDEEVLRAMAEHPILIERPIVVRGGRAVVGRPPETVQEILR